MKSAILIGTLLSSLAFPLQAEEEQQNDSEIIEKSVLWKAEINKSSWAPVELKKMVRDSSRFKPFGNFYEVLDDTKAFGGDLVYVGLVGVNFAMGPNVVVKSTHHEVAKYIEEKYEYELTFIEEGQNEGYTTSLGKNLKLVIIPHPSIEGASITIGEYTGL